MQKVTARLLLALDLFEHTARSRKTRIKVVKEVMKRFLHEKLMPHKATASLHRLRIDGDIYS